MRHNHSQPSPREEFCCFVALIGFAFAYTYFLFPGV